MEIAVDFDGTVVRHQYPLVGPTVDGAIELLRKLVDNKHNIILWTMRSGKHLQDAIDWYSTHNIPLYGINHNPSQTEWTKSPKAYAHIYIDDAAMGCPLIPAEIPGRPFVDWAKVEQLLIHKGVI